MVREEIKHMHIGKEQIKQSLFSDEMIIYIKNYTESKKKNPRIDDFNKVAGINSNHKSQLYFIIHCIPKF